MIPLAGWLAGGEGGGVDKFMSSFGLSMWSQPIARPRRTFRGWAERFDKSDAWTGEKKAFS